MNKLRHSHNTMKTNSRIQLFPVLRLVVFLVIGIVIGDALYGVVSVHVWFAAFVCATVSTLLVERFCMLQSALIFVCFVLIGACLTVNKLDTVTVGWPAEKIEYDAVIVSPPQVSAKIVKCDMVIVDKERPYKVKASIYNANDALNLKVGDGIHACSLLNEPRNFLGSDFDYRSYLLNHGFVGTTFIYADEWYVAAVDLTTLSVLERAKLSALAYRDKLLERFKLMDIDRQDYAVLAAMTFGERVTMSEEMTDDYSVSGALHVLSLSGMHLGIIYAMLLLLFMKRRRLVLVQVLIIIAIWSYVVIVGLPVSAVRSAIMLTVYSFVCLLNRNNVSLNALSVSAVIILIDNPLCLYDVGFQMSFVSVLFIIVFYKPIYNILPQQVSNLPLLNFIWSMSVISIAAQLGVAPLVAFYFGRFSCYFLLSNFIVVPASTIILYGVVILLCTGWWHWCQDILSSVLATTVRLMNEGVSYIASLPGSSIDGIRINIVQVFMFYVFVFALYVFMNYARKMLWVNKIKT